MKWIGRELSKNVQDSRGLGGGLAIGGGIGGVILLIITLLSGGESPIPLNTQTQTAPSPEQDEQAKFVAVVLKDTEDVWNKIFAEQGKDYPEPTLVLFTGSVQSGCGFASAATGPFYCPQDQKIYIDLAFYNDLKTRFGAPGDFAMAYVIAHEVGHHIQNIQGTLGKVHQQQLRLSKKEANALSVRTELQADFLAGMWAHHAQAMKNILETGDIEEALQAANAIGDDNLQKQSQGYVVPDAFTHGTSQQRMYWFKKGFETGNLSQGNTFDEL